MSDAEAALALAAAHERAAIHIREEWSIPATLEYQLTPLGLRQWQHHKSLAVQFRQQAKYEAER